MIYKISRRTFLSAIALFSTMVVAACSDSSDNGSSSAAYTADIVWTEYGIPHVTAKYWGSLGYGVGTL